VTRDAEIKDSGS
jgi:hypothetical protein